MGDEPGAELNQEDEGCEQEGLSQPSAHHQVFVVVQENVSLEANVPSIPVSLTRLREWMAGAGAGSAWISDPASIFYLTGFLANPHERLMALVVRGEGEAVLVVPDLERENAQARAHQVRVVSWRDGADPYRALLDALGDTDVLAVEKEHLTLSRLEGIEAGRVVDASPALRSFRAVKEPPELESLAEAARLTDRVTEAILAELGAGVSEREVATRLAALIHQTGASLAFPPLAQSGPNSALPHLGPSERRLASRWRAPHHPVGHQSQPDQCSLAGRVSGLTAAQRSDPREAAEVMGLVPAVGHGNHAEPGGLGRRRHQRTSVVADGTLGQIGTLVDAGREAHAQTAQALRVHQHEPYGRQGRHAHQPVGGREPVPGLLRQ